MLYSVDNAVPTSTTAETVLEDLVTTGYLCRIFKRSTLTIMHWRKEKQLPFVRIPGDGRDTIRYRITDVLAWAKLNRKRIHPSE